MKKRFWILSGLVLLALIISMVSLWQSSRSYDKQQAAEMRRIIDGLKEFEGVVSWVYDGDTVLIKSHGVKITARLWGIDTPEKKQPGGKEALWYLVKLAKNKKIKVIPMSSDKYGRLIAKLYVKDTFINLEMIQSGNAWWYEHFSPDWTAGKQAQAEAKAAKRGIWSAAIAPKNPYVWRKEHRRQ